MPPIINDRNIPNGGRAVAQAHPPATYQRGQSMPAAPQYSGLPRGFNYGGVPNYQWWGYPPTQATSGGWMSQPVYNPLYDVYPASGAHYSAPGSREGYEQAGIPPVMYQRSPYATLAFRAIPNAWGGASVQPLIGFPSRYPHVVSGVPMQPGSLAMAITAPWIMPPPQRPAAPAAAPARRRPGGTSPAKKPAADPPPAKQQQTQPTEQPREQPSAAAPAPGRIYAGIEDFTRSAVPTNHTRLSQPSMITGDAAIDAANALMNYAIENKGRSNSSFARAVRAANNIPERDLAEEERLKQAYGFTFDGSTDPLNPQENPRLMTNAARYARDMYGQDTTGIFANNNRRAMQARNQGQGLGDAVSSSYEDLRRRGY